MSQAASLHDPIGHSPTMNWLLQGAVIGLAAGLATVAIVGTGGLAAVAIVGGMAAGGAGVMEMLSTLSSVPKEVTGMIDGPCSGNVFINGRRAARAHVDLVKCAKHAPVPLPIATGSGNVYINGSPAARVSDTIACSAVITAGSANVFIGGGSQRTDTIEPEQLVPPLVHGAMLVVGIGAAVVLAGPIVAVAGLALGMAGGMAGAWAGGKLFGEGSDGQILSTLGGGMLGGMLGGKGGSILAGKLLPRPTTPLTGFVKGGLPGVKTVQENSFESVYAKAPAAKAEIDAIADDVAGSFGGRVAKAPIKSQERAMQKINNDYDGDATRIKDLARNTIIVAPEHIEAATAQLSARGANVKVVDGSVDALGYSGVNATLKTQAGITAEMQVNSPAMIYAKEPPPLARALLGDPLYDAVAARSGVPGGLGHGFYEQWRVLDPKSAAAQTIAEQSQAYYGAIRSANASQ